MSELSSDLTKLLVESAFAAVNNNLLKEAAALNEAIQTLELNSSLKQVCQAIIYLGMGQDSQALLAAKNSDMVEARAVESLVGQSMDLDTSTYDENEPAVQLMKLLSESERS
ncbi:DUF1039 domain-containing protein [Vibrio marisflavi]|uniref:EscG/YscG/SsaH family type III secretion system needle protein co-chaperone n=1 Tax=Vibrio marisflavi CECT 7928 TaxID=634439 RepID=A0ABM8ZYG0_9VIBR|nr:DUF1039 domain-containing protein [Vibrio marisflavi]CAH0535959.1 hypothetical protein VMF7928_00071 [Vibrio marisflavi CECT 7928]